MKKIDFKNIEINNGFWHQKQNLVKNTTVYAVYNRFKETYRFDALKCDVSKKRDYEPHIFWDSDVVKWMEGVFYMLAKDDISDIKKIADEAIEDIIKNSDENGYFNSHFQTVRPSERFQHRSQHELYCAGHLIESAVAHYTTTGEKNFIDAACRFADYIDKVFRIENSAAFATPGHPELELALVRLYEVTDNKKYLDLAEYFINQHGCNEKDKTIDKEKFSILYNQDEMPLRERTTANGHCVRALYLMCAMADVAYYRQDNELMDACVKMFDNITEKRMYITGAVGSSHLGENFTWDYHLPNRTAYAETCASIALVLFAARMQAISPERKYADVLERALYNGVLSGISMNGKEFFYTNPLEINIDLNREDHCVERQNWHPVTTRREVFDCSCCPPNMVRFIPQVAGFMYTCNDDVFYVHHFIDSICNDGNIKISQTTEYPENGRITINCTLPQKEIAIRIPSWCKSFKINKEYTEKNGYAYIKTEANQCIEIDFEMSVKLVRANPNIRSCAGRVAVTKGPVVYCLEGIDNGKNLHNIRIDKSAEFTEEASEFLLPVLKTTGLKDKETENLYYDHDNLKEKTPLTFIPYYAFANRGESDMIIWILE